MKKFRLRSPYKANGRTNFPDARKRKGVYLIYINNKLRYVGHSGSDLYKTMYRHFQNWDDPTQRRVSYQGMLNNKRYKIKVRVVYTNTAKQAERLEKGLILKYKPNDNPIKYSTFFEEEPKREQKAVQDILDDYIEINVSDEVPF